MSANTTLYQPPLEQNHVRWTLTDLLLIASVTIGLAMIVVLAVQLPGLLGFSELRAALTSRPLITSMIIGGIVYGLAVIATYFVIVRRAKGSWRDIGFRTPPILILMLTPVLFIGQMVVLILTNLVIVGLMGEFENPQVAALTDPAGFSWLNFGLVFFVGAILAPIVEELLFRGLLYQWLRGRTTVAVAVVLSAALFAVVHFIPLLIPALLVVGIVLALVFEWTKSLWINITLHFFQNALGISVIFLLQAFPELLPQTT